MHQAFDALLQLDERAVVGNADHAAADVRADRITLRSVEPRIGRELLEAERHALLFAVELQHLHLDLIAHLHQVARMRQASPGHVGDVQQTVDAAEVDERAVVGQVLHRAGQDAVFVQLLERLAALLRSALLPASCLRETTMLPRFLFSLMMRTSIVVTLQAVEVAHRAQIDLRAGQESARAKNVDRQAALDAIDDASLYRSLVVVGLLNLVPGAQTLRLLVREVDVALFGVARARA